MQEISKKMLMVMKKCATIAKNGFNNFHRYKYAMAADVAEKVNAALVEAGIAVYCKPEVVETSIVMTKDGKQENLVTIKMAIDLVDTVTGETAYISGLGAGQDPGDKAIMKAQTAALKYAWMSSLVMAAGDDPECDEEMDRRLGKKEDPGKIRSFQKQSTDTTRQGTATAPETTKRKENPGKCSLNPAVIGPDQVRRLRKLIAETSSNEEKFLRYLKVDRLTDLPAERFEWAVKSLDLKKNAVSGDHPNRIITALAARRIPFKVNEETGEMHATPSYQDNVAKTFLKEQGFKWNSSGRNWIMRAA